MSMKTNVQRKPEMSERDAIDESLSESLGPISDNELAEMLVAHNDRQRRLRRASGEQF